MQEQKSHISQWSPFNFYKLYWEVESRLSSLRSSIKFYTIIFCLLFPSIGSFAQQAVYIPPTGKVFAHAGDQVGIFGDVTNEGDLGSSPGTVINFLGQEWKNTQSAVLSGATGLASAPGGVFRFLGTSAQNLSSGYNFNTKAGPSFPNLSVENKSGVWLQDLNDLLIRGNLNFNNGYLYLNGWNTVVDDTVTGYSDKGYVVTGGGIGGGSLYREPHLTDKQLVFPVGTEPGSYSPFAMKSNQPGNNIVGATVFNHVYIDVTSGTVIDTDYVKKTWQITSGEGKLKTTVLIQHQESDEGARFPAFRDSSYISLYQTGEGAWDIDLLSHDAFSPGTLTTGAKRNNTFMNDRIFPNGIPHQVAGSPGLDSVNWFTVNTTKYSSTRCPVADFNLLEVQRYNYKWVQLFWRTLRELNVMRFDVQKRVDTAVNYHTVVTIPAKNVNGVSDQLLYYDAVDSAVYDGAIDYRLRLTSKNGCVAYTAAKKISFGRINITAEVWPNPTLGPIQVKVFGTKHDVKMQVTNVWGQVLGTYTVPPNTNYSTDLSGLPAAPYILFFRDPKQNNKTVASFRLIVTPAK